ncbi:hypothetical protein CsatB_015935 [Cannabis sativa]
MMTMMKKMILIMVIMAVLVGCSYGDGLRCRTPGEFCHWTQGKYCCEGLFCGGPLIGEGSVCEAAPNCQPNVGGKCFSGSFQPTPCCYPNKCSVDTSGYGEGTCLAHNSIDNNNVTVEISYDDRHISTATY